MTPAGALRSWVTAVTIDARQAHGTRGMHRRLVRRGVAGNTAGIFPINLRLSLSEQAGLLGIRLRCTHAAFENQQRKQDTAYQRED